jgi:flagellar basal-body rod protein FlgB
MSLKISNIFSSDDQIQMESLNHRLKRNQLINANIANAETPGYKALEYRFEKELQDISEGDNQNILKTLYANQQKSNNFSANLKITPKVNEKPSESVPQDGNTVDIDAEMALLAKNQILYRTAVEALNRKIGVLKYAISGGN